MTVVVRSTPLPVSHWAVCTSNAGLMHDAVAWWAEAAIHKARAACSSRRIPVIPILDGQSGQAVHAGGGTYVLGTR